MKNVKRHKNVVISNYRIRGEDKEDNGQAGGNFRHVKPKHIARLINNTNDLNQKTIQRRQRERKRKRERANQGEMHI